MDLLEYTDHRPWSLPDEPWLMTQTWTHLLFAHWPVSPEVIRPMIPEGLELDCFYGNAWIGIVPFYLSDLRVKGVPDKVPDQSFLELNVRTYVTRDNKPGVWFFSLDAASWPAVIGARLLYKLPYFHAQMSMSVKNEEVYYSSYRAHWNAPGGNFLGTYSPVSDIFRPEPGMITHWLTERYCLYTADKLGHLYRCDIHHIPWPLQHARANILSNTMAFSHHILLPDRMPLLHYSHHQDVMVWPLKKIT
jgi:uncharacterized protein